MLPLGQDGRNLFLDRLGLLLHLSGLRHQLVAQFEARMLIMISTSLGTFLGDIPVT